MTSLNDKVSPNRGEAILKEFPFLFLASNKYDIQ
jgi:hypothetical protein